MIDVKNLSKSFGDHLVLDDITESHPGRGEGGHHRPLRLRQVHLPALSQPAGDPHQGDHYLQRHRDHRSQGEDRPDPPADGDGVPAFQPVPQHDHPKKHHPRPGAHQALDPGRGRRHRPPPCCAGWDWRTRRTPTPPSSPAGRSSASPSSVPWP